MPPLQISKEGFEQYLRQRWTPAGYGVSDELETPHKEQVKVRLDGFSFGLAIEGGDGSPGQRARVGVWFRPAPKGGMADLASLRSHYQQRLQAQGRGCRIHQCPTAAGTFVLFWETTSTLPEGVVGAWTEMVETLSGLCFDPESLESFLEEQR